MRLTLFIFTSLFLVSCAPKIKNFDQYQKQFLSKTAFMPSKESFTGKEPKIVVFALDENDNEHANQANLGKSIADNVENILSQNKLAEIVDRRAAIKLKHEISLAEINNTGAYKGPIVADYAISGSISNAGFTSKYSAGFFYPDPRTKQIITVPPKYTYSTDVAGNLKIYELPSLQVIKAIEFDAKKNRQENARQDGGLSWGGLQVGGKKVNNVTRDDNMLRQTGETAVNNIEIDIKNFFAKKGYILEKRVNGKKAIFKISLGSLDGIKQGDKFEIIGKYDTQNPITEEPEIERRVITHGVVSDKIDPKTAWVLIKDKEKINQIRLGDTVKIIYERGAFSKIKNLLK